MLIPILKLKRFYGFLHQKFVSFTSKTKLVDHYEKTIGATHVGGNKMIIFPQQALKLIKKYFPN